MTLGRANEKDPLLKASTSFHNMSLTTNNQISLSFSPFVASSCAYDDESIQSYNDLNMVLLPADPLATCLGAQFHSWLILDHLAHAQN